MAKLYLICGKLCSGKTHYARALARRTGAVLFSCDELMLRLFPEYLGDDHDRISAAARAYLLDMALAVARAGTGAILDWGFWSAADRQAITAQILAAGCAPEWHYIDVSDEDWQRNIRNRNEEAARGDTLAYHADEGLIGKCLSAFEVPRREEIDVWVRPERG